MTAEKACEGLEIFLDVEIDNKKSDLAEALQTAIEALQKQIPTKPEIPDWIHCPGCRTILSSNPIDYCPRCGQALKWED